MAALHAPAFLFATTLTIAAADVARAASARIDSFSAGATTVVAGSRVDFSVSYSADTASWSNGGSNLVEPPLQEGYQEWSTNWYFYEHETLHEVALQAAGLSHLDRPALAAGASHAGRWDFSLDFPAAGRFDVVVGGQYAVDVETYSSHAYASNDCYLNDFDDPGSLICYGWTYQIDEWGDRYRFTDALPAHQLTIEVLPAAVPEPQTMLMVLAGGGLLWSAARRRRQATA